MAQRLMTASLTLGMLLAASSASQAALAQALSDPMRPPAVTSPEQKAEAAESVSRLQSVLISPSRSVAVIDGRSVGLGERVGDATVISISPAEVTLRRGAERQILKLHPGTETKPAEARISRKVKP